MIWITEGPTIHFKLSKFDRCPRIKQNQYSAFYCRASSPLAQLYSTSTMEHHHFDQCLMILNSPGNQVLANLSSDDYSQVIHVLEDAILSTDLAVYFRYILHFSQSMQSGKEIFIFIYQETRTFLAGNQAGFDGFLG